MFQKSGEYIHKNIIIRLSGENKCEKKIVVDV